MMVLNEEEEEGSVKYNSIYRRAVYEVNFMVIDSLPH